MIALTALLAVVIGLLFLYRYLSHFLSALLSRLLHCEICQLDELSPRRVGRVRLRFRDYNLELRDLSLSSSFWNPDLTKPFYLSVEDARIEKRAPEHRPSPAPSNKNNNSNEQAAPNACEEGVAAAPARPKVSNAWKWLQYFGCRVGHADFALLDDPTDSMLHVSVEHLSLETFRDRSGLQVELQFLLAQLKLFKRSNAQKHVFLADFQLTGRVSVDVAEADGQLKKLGLKLTNPRISVSDVLFDYLIAHPPKRAATSPNNNNNSAGASENRRAAHTSLAQRLAQLPHLDVQLDDVLVEFLAVSAPHSIRTLAVQLRQVRAAYSAADQTGAARLLGLQISDHEAQSRFHCSQFAAAVRRPRAARQPGAEPDAADQPAAAAAQFVLDFKLAQPTIDLYKNDLAWWMHYCRSQPLDRVLASCRPEPAPDQRPPPAPDEAVNLCVEVTHFQCILRVRDGPVISVGAGLAVFSSDYRLRNAELGVESLWCHRGSDPCAVPHAFDRHQWGTVVAIGGGLFQLQRADRQLQVFGQLDECQFEWEEQSVAQIVEFAKLLKSPEGAAAAGRPPAAAQPKLQVSVQVSAKKLALFFNAKNAGFIGVFTESSRFALLAPADLVQLQANRLRLVTGQLDPQSRPWIATDWARPDGTPQCPALKRHGACDKLVLKLELPAERAAPRRLCVDAEADLELCWSPLGYAVLHEVVTKSKQLLRDFSPAAASPTTRPPMEIHVKSDFNVELGFELPNEHFMRWVVPSILFVRSEGNLSVSAPTFLLELDEQIIMTLDEPHIERKASNALMDISRQEFKQLRHRTNRCWLWSAQSLQILFPYQFNFAAAFEEILNSIKWIKKLHNVQRKPFTSESPLPSDLRVHIKEAVLQMDDDPFEIKLQLIYEVLKDEVVERERRRQMLDQKLDQLLKENLMLSDAKVDALYQSLIKKDEQIYCERIQKVQKQPKRHLLTWRVKDLDIKAFADPVLHGKANCVRLMRQFNAESPLPDAFDFSTLWARCVEVDVGEWYMQFRDYPLPYLHMRDGHMWGTLVGAEHLAGNRSMRECSVRLPPPWGLYTIEKNMCPLKFYYDLESEFTDLKAMYGPCWEPCLSMISLCWRYINHPSRDPSPTLAFWDKVRLLLHGRFTALVRRLCTSILASPDPYNETELIEMSWEGFEFDWITGQFRIHTDLDAYVRTASKYDDSRLLHLPDLKLMVQLDWACLSDQHDHHSVTPVAPNKLPDYITTGGHDSYRSFRSSHVDIQLTLEASQSPDNRQSPQLLLYANTFKWLDFLKNTLTMVNRPVKRGKVFNEPLLKRHQLSRHFRNIHLNLTLPRFLISYWMSFSSSYGFRLASDSLCMASSLVMNSPPVAPAPPANAADGDVRRRLRRALHAKYVSVQLEKAQIHLFGQKCQPDPEERMSEHDDSFFIGLSRLNYVRESETEQKKADMAKRKHGQHPLQLSVQPKHRRTASLTAKLQNATGRTSTSDANGNPQAEADKPAVHRLTVHDLRAAWTTENRDACLAIMDGVQKAYLLRKVLSNDAMKMFRFNSAEQSQQTRNRVVERAMERRESKVSDLNSPSKTSPDKSDDVFEDESEELLWRLINEAETNLVAYSEETVEPPTNSLLGIALCAMDDVVLNNWQVDLLNSQVVLKGHETDSFILLSAARASITQRYHVPVWRSSQLLLKRSYTSLLSGMQYFAPLTIRPQQAAPPPPQTSAAAAAEDEPPQRVPLWKRFQWLSREIIEEKDPTHTASDKINKYSSSGEAVGGVVSTPAQDPTAADQPAPNVQLQRVASRCSCQMFFCYYSDLINMEKFEDFVVPQITEEKTTKYGERREDVDCFTLKHNMLEVCTNSDQYQVILDIVNNLVLFVDPKKKTAQDMRRRLWFKLSKKSKHEVGETVQRLQNELREVVTHIRSLERQNFFAQLQSSQSADSSSAQQINEERVQQIEKFKLHQGTLIDELALTISVYKEKSVEEQTALHRRLKQIGRDENGEWAEGQVEIARRFEVCFEDCIWRLTEADGQISITEVQIRNFLYNRAARIDNSGEHLLEIGTVKVLNLLPNSKYKETLARLPKPEGGPLESDKTPAIRVICRDLPPVGGISVKEHFEVNIVPMQAQITYRFFEKMMSFFFPGRQIEREDQSLDAEEQGHSQQSFRLAQRFRGAVHSSFRSSRLNLHAGAAEPGQRGAAPPGDEIDRMKERADRNNMFVYIIIPPVPFIVSYKGNKEKNIEDVDRFNLTFPLCEYHDKNWTWLDLALAIKKSYRNILVQQFMKQKILRKSQLQAMEPIGEEEKKRIVLGTTGAEPASAKKKKKK